MNDLPERLVRALVGQIVVLHTASDPSPNLAEAAQRAMDDLIYLARHGIRDSRDEDPRSLASNHPVAVAHQLHYRQCGCLDDSSVCCVSSCLCHTDRTRS